MNGVVVSSQTFCNTVDFLDMGPPNTLSQYQTFLASRFGSKTLVKSNQFVGFPQESNILYDLFKWYPQPTIEQQNTIPKDVPFNV